MPNLEACLVRLNLLSSCIAPFASRLHPSKKMIWVLACLSGLLVGRPCRAEGLPRPIGARIWSCSLDSEVGAAPAIGPDGTVFCTTRTSICAIDKDTGTVQWKCSTNGWALGSPSVGRDGTVYVGLGALHAIDSIAGKETAMISRPIRVMLVSTARGCGLAA